MVRKKDIDPEDAALWALVTEDVTPIKGRKRVVVADAPLKTPPAPPQKRARAPKPVMPRAEVSVSVPSAHPGVGLDTRSRNRLERGQMTIEATIDLHGHTQATARDTLVAFLLSSYHAGRRCVLVITGKGRLTKDDEKPWWDSKRGVLKSGFGQWVKEAPLDRIVLHTTLARGHHGGGGAFYVLLRRDRA